jgi:hypothetical protein
LKNIKVPTRFAALVITLALACAGVSSRAQDAEAARHKSYDELLDLNVRDGFVYYRALKSERARLDAYVNALASVDIAAARKSEQMAFWINAYNALVLETVVDHYPIAQRTREYPPHSIRQIPGAFERTPHRVAGQTLTLDQIEATVLPKFQDPRVFLALGRGAIGSGRLRSEAYSASDLDRQLGEAAAECASRAQCVQIKQGEGRMLVSSIFSWRRNEFSDTYADQAPTPFVARSPIERAVLALISPKMLTTEREFLMKNTFKVEYLPFDWSLNDLTGRGGR